MAARRMSLTIRTSLRSQRSTNVPANGERNRFGSVAKTNAKAPATTPATDETMANSAIVWIRSPRIEMS